MSEVKEGHQCEDMAEQASGATNQGREDRDSTKGEEKVGKEGCSPDIKSTPTNENRSNLNQDNVKNHGDDTQASPQNEEPTPINDPNSDTASSSESTNPDIKNGNDLTIQNRDSTKGEEKVGKEGCSPDIKSKLTNENRSNLNQDNVKNHGDDTQASPQNEEPTPINDPNSDKGHTRKDEAPKSTTSQNQDNKKDDPVDGPKTKLKNDIPDLNGTDTESKDAVAKAQDAQESTTLPQKQQLNQQSNDVETIGPTTPEATETAVPEVTGGSGKLYSLLAVGVVVVAILVSHLLQQESSPQTSDVRQIDIFLRQLEKVKTQFPNQRAELWNRSRIHLKRHLQTAQPTEPVSLILTAGLRAERTLICLAQGLASAFSSALNASFLHIDGASKASQDSDQVKLDIDRKLQGAFEGDKPVAIIHRFEELPPGSTLIFYRYCDHENAAYKKTFLIFTVLLGEEDEIPAKINLSAVEEMVDDHLQKKFLSHGQPVSFDMMDLDKYGGLWSRISHLILPVAAEKRIELEGC